MMQKTSVIALAILFGLALCGHAGTIVFQLNLPNGDMGTSHTFTQDGIKIVAYSYAIGGGSPPDLYGKNGGGDETGLGLTHDPDDEINSSDFVQMDFANPISLKVSPVQFEMGSVQPGEGWALYGSNTKGVLGTDLLNSNALPAGSTPEGLLTLPEFGDYRYYSWTATSKNVLLDEIVLTGDPDPAPEPGTMAATGAALIGLSLVLRRLHKPR